MKKNFVVIIFSFCLLLQSSAIYAQNFEAYKAYTKGLLEQKSGKLKASKKDYEKAIALDPAALIIYKDLMYLDWQMGNKDDAIKTAQKIEEIDGQDPKTTAYLGSFYLMAEKPEIARALWDKTLEIDPKNESALSSIAIQYFNDSKFEESAKYWKDFLDQEPASVWGHLQLGMVQERLEKPDEALKTYDKLLDINREAGEAFIAKARVYENTRKFDKAVEQYLELVKLYPDNYYVKVYLGRCYYLMGENEKAREELVAAKEKLPGDLNTAYWLGAVYERYGQIDKAIEEFEFIAAVEDNFTVLAKLGYFYSMTRQYQKAEKYFMKALKFDPKNTELLYLIALNYLDSNRTKDSITYLTKSVEVSPNFAEGFFFLGVAYDRAGDFPNAEKALLRTIELSPDHLRALNYLGYMYADRAINLEKSKIFLEKAVTAEPTNAVFLHSLGWLYFRMGRPDIAAGVILTSVNMTRDPLGYVHLGDAYVALGNNADAWVVYTLAFDASGDKKIKVKIDEVQKKLSKEELFSKMLFRSESHYLKMFSLKTGYKMAISAGAFKKANAFVPISYVKSEGISIDIFGSFIPNGVRIYIKDEKITFVPKAIKEELPPEFMQLLTSAAEIFKGKIFRNFDNVNGQIKGNEVIYSKDGIVLVLNLNDALIKKIIKDDITVEITAYKKFFTSQIPSKIKVISVKKNINITLEMEGNPSFATEHIIIPQDEPEKKKEVKKPAKPTKKPAPKPKKKAPSKK